ncbi:MAG: TatD family hydrolase [Pseudomonadales bacterium]
MMLIDIGANLTHDSFAEDLDKVLERAAEAGVTQLIVTGASIAGSERAAELAQQHPQLYATAGMHPHHAKDTTDDALVRFRELAAQDKVVALGETGLDFFRDFSPRPAQIASFEKHLELAADTGLPLFLHERDAHPTFAQVLVNYRDKLSQVVVHCFTGEKEALHAYLDLDCHIGITGWICDERRGLHLHKLVRDIPQNRLMIETDSPYLMPRTLKPRPNTRRNEPMYLTAVCATVAECLALTHAEVAQFTSRNARDFFGLPDSQP